MNAQQMAEIQRRANGDPQRMIELVVDHHLANTYANDLNAYVDGMGRTVDSMVERHMEDQLQGVLPFLMELHRRGASQDRIRPVLDRILAAVEAASQSAKSAASKGAQGARRLRKTKTGRRVRKATRRGRKGHF